MGHREVSEQRGWGYAWLQMATERENSDAIEFDAKVYHLIPPIGHILPLPHSSRPAPRIPLVFIKWILGPYGGDTTPRIPLVFVKWILGHPGRWGEPPHF